MPEAEGAAIEEHLFSCADCGAGAAELDAIVRGIRSAARTAEIGGVVTDAVLNRLARDGVRVRTYTLSPGAVVPCAVWDEDELMALRLRGDFGAARELTLSRRVAGAEVDRMTIQVPAGTHGEIIVIDPAATIRRLPAAEVELILTTQDGDEERQIGRYTLVHGGALERR